MPRIGSCLSFVCLQLAAVNTLLGRPRGVPVGTGGLTFVVAPLAICHGLPWTGPAWMFQLCHR